MKLNKHMDDECERESRSLLLFFFLLLHFLSLESEICVTVLSGTIQASVILNIPINNELLYYGIDKQDYCSS